MQPDLDSLPLVLTVEETAKALRISRGSAYEGIRSGAIPHVRIGRTIRVPRHMLASLLSGSNGHAHDGPGGPQLSQVEDAR